MGSELQAIQRVTSNATVCHGHTMLVLWCEACLSGDDVESAWPTGLTDPPEQVQRLWTERPSLACGRASTALPHSHDDAHQPPSLTRMTTRIGAPPSLTRMTTRISARHSLA
jgi:hypothetical protein